MSEKENCRIHDFSKYDEMTTEELEEILRLDAENTEDQESDTEILLYVMEVLTKRRMNNGHTSKTAQEAYESFKQHYMPEIDNEDIIPVEENAPRRRSFRWVRVLAATAAVFIIVVFGSVTAKAFGFDIWEAVIQWTQETFHFGNWKDSPNEGNTLPYASLQEALVDHNVSTPLAPGWIPCGYKLVVITVEQAPSQRIYRAKYASGESTLKITVQDYLEKIPVYVEQCDGLVEEYVVSGITYYIFEDINVVKAVWINGSYECDIMGNVTIEELKMMINSIEKG